jgi:putative restriction endonuclease
MRYWWVNQNQTYRHEISGGYLWSPKRKSNQQRNPFYESMREVAPDDIVLAFFDTRIAALGLTRSFCYESPKPTEFGNAGVNWGAIGWKGDVIFRDLSNRIRPKDHIGELRGFLREKYAPLRSNGDGLQGIYLTEVGSGFAAVLFRLIGHEANQVADVGTAMKRAEPMSPALEPSLEEWEQRAETAIRSDSRLAEMERQALVQARRGQGVFRTNVQIIERACRVTRVERREHLIASHIKPWRDGSNDERLNGENGLLLTPTIDHLFDKGFISFENNGDLLVSPVADGTSVRRMGISTEDHVNVGSFSEGQRRFLDYHRDNVLRMSQRGKARHRN